jgi:ABC-type transporter Mla MlaB component
MLDAVRDEHARALAEGYTGLSMTGDVGAGLHDAVGSQRLAEYERRLDEEILGGTRLLLCQYDHPELDDETMSQATGAHHVDVPPELAAIGRAGMLAAARARSPETVRLAGELDFESAVTVAEALDATFEGPRRVDLADLNYIDVTGMRALRGRAGEALTITPASDPVRRLVGLLGWDTDPDVRVGA